MYSNSNKFANITNPNLIDYITAEQHKDKIIDIPECKNVYDDNIAVRSLGYNNCTSANADYYHRNLDINNKYGYGKSLAEMCPVSTKSDEYIKCMKLMLNKFNTNANILDKINIDMSEIINTRINDRNDILNNIEITLNPYIHNKDQTDFNNLGGSQIVNLDNINNYYETKYGSSKSVFANVPSNLEIYNIDPTIQTTFFGTYKPIKGQYTIFNNLIITLNYDLDDSNTHNKKVILSIRDNTSDIEIVYRVINLDYYIQNKTSNDKVIKIDLFDQNIVSSSSDTTLQQLLITLGITVPNRILLKYEEFTSSENIVHKTYKIMTNNMATVMMMEKID